MAPCQGECKEVVVGEGIAASPPSPFFSSFAEISESMSRKSSITSMPLGLFFRVNPGSGTRGRVRS